MGLLDIGGKLVTGAAKTIVKDAAIMTAGDILTTMEDNAEKKAKHKNEKSAAVPKDFEDSYCISLKLTVNTSSVYSILSGDNKLSKLVRDSQTNDILLLNNAGSEVGRIDQYNSLIINNTSWGTFLTQGKKQGEKWKLPYNGWTVKKTSIDNNKNPSDNKYSYEVIGKIKPIIHILFEDNWRLCTIRMRKKDDSLLACLIAFMIVKTSAPDVIENTSIISTSIKKFFNKD